MKPYVVAITGASGAIYGVRLLQVMAEMNMPVELVISDTAKIVMKEELGIEGITQDNNRCLTSWPQSLTPGVEKGIHLHDFHDFTAPIASGSYPVAGMVIVPCSMGTLGAIASGLSQNLIQRAADCTIKEGRKLVIVPRETPLSVIHLENMLKLARLGVRIVPPMPAFYGAQQQISDLVDFIVGKILDQLGISHGLYPRWVGSLSGDQEGLS
ncbi:MAG TPA: flavin prenyltransferase UbiX [Candidatus Omnitrophota bacterium]|nr:flavin prenyltransferase UbiX [Candidatus Omnitrophota bacterium]